MKANCIVCNAGVAVWAWLLPPLAARLQCGEPRPKPLRRALRLATLLAVHARWLGCPSHDLPLRSGELHTRILDATLLFKSIAARGAAAPA